MLLFLNLAENKNIIKRLNLLLRYKEDPWLWDLDWKVPKKRKSKKGAVESEPSYPNWYRKLLYKVFIKDSVHVLV